MRIILIILCTLTLLSGCAVAIPAAFVAGATAGGELVYDKRSFNVMLQDHNSATYAQNWINRDPKLKNKSHINIDVLNHVALLVGEAETPELRQRAFNIAEKTKHINRIYNEITISRPISFARRADDSWITTKVKSKMLTQAGLHSTQIRVLTENGVVYLMGLVSPQQAKLATKVARRISGVKEVVKVFQYS